MTSGVSIIIPTCNRKKILKKQLFLINKYSLNYKKYIEILIGDNSNTRNNYLSKKEVNQLNNNFFYIKNKSSIKMTNGKQKIEILHIDDVMKSVLSGINLLKSGKSYNKTYYLNSKYIISVKKFCLLCCRLMNKKIYFKWGSLKNRNNDYFNPSLFKPSFPNFKQSHNLETSILRSL